jgi:hypothetical protein
MLQLNIIFVLTVFSNFKKYFLQEVYMRCFITLISFFLISFIAYSQIFTNKLLPENIILDKPSDFPKITVHVNDNPAPGYILLNSYNQNILTPKFLMVVDSLGEPYLYKKVLLTPVLDLKLQQNGLYSYAQAIAAGESHNIAGRIVRNAKTINYILDPQFNLIDSVQCGNGYLSDPHEFLILPNGNYLTLAYESFPVNMSQLISGGNPNAIAIGTVIQELNRDKKCVFQWRSLDNLPLTHTYANIANASFEHVHANSYYVDTDGNLMTSFTAAFEISKINLITGEFIWHFGGKLNDFEISGDDDNLPYHSTNQHDIKRLPNGNFLYFDNGFAKSVPFSRAVEFAVDEKNKKANLVWDYRRTPDISAFAMGSAQRLPNGNTLINWGLIFGGDHRTATEVTPDKKVTYEISLPAETYSYRAFKYQYPVCKPLAKVTVAEVVEGNSYEFNNKNGDAGAEIMINSIEGFMYNYLTLEKYECGALNVAFEKEPPLVIPGRYKLTTKMVNTISGDLSFDISKLPPRYDYSTMKVYFRKVEGNGAFKEIATYYDGLNNKLVASISDTGEYVMGFERIADAIRQPALVMPFNNSRFLNNRPVKLIWSPNGRYDSFSVQIASDESFSEIVTDTSALTETSLLAKLPSNSNYFWRVKTRYRDIESKWSEPWQLLFSDSLLSVVYPKKGDTLVRDSVAIIKWETNLPDSLQITIHKNGELLATIKDSLFSHFNSYAWKVPKSIPASDDYTIAISSIKSKDKKTLSGQFSIGGMATDIELSETTSADISITPNPSSDYIEISGRSVIRSEAKSRNGVETSVAHPVLIFDILGMEVLNNYQLSILNSQLRINISTLSPGVYFVRVGNVVRKFVKL